MKSSLRLPDLGQIHITDSFLKHYTICRDVIVPVPVEDTYDSIPGADPAFITGTTRLTADTFMQDGGSRSWNPTALRISYSGS